MIPAPPCGKKYFWVIYCLIASIPVLYGFYYVAVYGVNIPVWDQWDSIVPRMISYLEGDLHGTWLIGAQNDSRAFFPRLLSLFFSIITNLNIKILYFIGYFFYCIAFLLVFLEIRKDLEGNPSYLLFVLPVLFYWFNPYFLARFIYNLGGFSSGFLILAVITTVLLLDRSRNSNWYFGSAVMMAVVCSFSGAWGLVIWFAGCIQILLQTVQGKGKRLVVWLSSAGIVFYVYFIALGFRETGAHGTSGYRSYIETALTYPVHKFLCYMSTLGSQISQYPRLALFSGILLACIFVGIMVTNRKDLQLDILSKWYSLILFWATTTLALALARSGTIGFPDFGPPDAVYFIPHFRHSPTIFFTLIGLFILSLMYLHCSRKQEKTSESRKMSIRNLLQGKPGRNRVLAGVLFCLLIVSTGMHVIPGIAIGRESAMVGIEGQYYLMNIHHISDENLRILHPNPVSIRGKVAKLEEYNLSVFAAGERERFNRLPQFGYGLTIADLPRINATTLYDIEFIGTTSNPIHAGVILLDKTESPIITISGWGIDSLHNSLAKAVFISIDDEIYIPAWYRRERNDRIPNDTDNTFKDSGFWGSLNTSTLNEGYHNVSIKIVSWDGRGYFQSENINIRIVS